MRRDEATLLDIARAARLVLAFKQGMTKEAFLDDAKTQSSVLYQLIVIGEAVKRLSSEFRARHPEILWSLIAGMRDHLIHGYDAVDWDEVWKTAMVDVPDLLGKIESLLPKARSEPQENNTSTNN
jgi:uncharacterized protein with HEPN domain